MPTLTDQKSSLFGKPKGSAAPPGQKASVTASSTADVPLPISAPKVPGKTASLSANPSKSVTNSSVGVVLSPAARARKVEEAKEESALGMKALKTSVFQWSPDHLAAAPHFESSSNAYKAAGEFELARLMMLQSAESHDAAGCTAAAAVTCVKAATISQFMNRTDLSSLDFQKSAEYWGIQGELDKCADLLSKAAKELVTDQPQQALALYIKGNKRVFSMFLNFY